MNDTTASKVPNEAFAKTRDYFLGESLKHFRLKWSGGVNADSKVAVLFSGFPEYGKEQHTGREKEIERIDCCQ